MLELPEWVGKIADLAQKTARLTGNVESLSSEVVRLSEKLDKAQDKIRDLEAELRVVRAEVKGEAQVAAVNAVIQAHEQMIERIHRVERQLDDGFKPDRLANHRDGPAVST